MLRVWVKFLVDFFKFGSKNKSHESEEYDGWDSRSYQLFACNSASQTDVDYTLWMNEIFSYPIFYVGCDPYGHLRYCLSYLAHMQSVACQYEFMSFA